MSGSAFHIAAAFCSVIEWFILTGAGYLIFRQQRYTLAEAGAYAVVSVFFVLSFLFQAAFLAGLLKWTWLAELALTAAAVTILFIRRRLMATTGKTVWRMIRRNRLAGIGITLVWGFLLIQAVMPPTGLPPWQELDPLQMAPLLSGTLAANPTEFPLYALGYGTSLNQAILSHLFLRTRWVMGIGLPGFWAYIAIAFATYALSRRYAWPATSLTVTLVVVSMPRFVFLSTTASSEIIIASSAVFCLLAAYRAIERPNMIDLSFLICGILFGIGPDRYSLSHVLLLMVLALVLLFRRHGTGVWFRIAMARRRWLWVVFAVILVFSQSWHWANDLTAGDTAAAPLPAAALAYNTDGIQGALANLLRYLFETAHFTQPIDHLCQYVFGFKLSGLLQQLHDRIVVAAMGNPGTNLKLTIQWIPDARYAWFGPFGILLSIPAVAYALRRAPRRLKAIAVVLVGYWFLTALVLSWQPRNVAYFSIFFGCSGACMALFLSPWRITRRGRRNIQLAAVVLLVYAAVSNQQKPFIGLTTIKQASNGSITSTAEPDSAPSKAVAALSVAWRRHQPPTADFTPPFSPSGDRRYGNPE